jgi:cell division protein FtsL
VPSAAHTRAAVSSRVGAPPGLEDEPWEEARVRQPAPARPARSAARARTRLPRTLLVFVVCLALLAVARISLSFAVVQKNLATTRIVGEQRALTAENSRLAEEAATLSSTLRVRDLAVDELHLAPARTVMYLRAHARVPRPDRGR